MGQAEESSDDVDLNVETTFKNYVSTKKFGASDKFLNINDYIKLDFMNDVPEIVCDILCYLSRHVHHRSNHIEKKVYEHLLFSQIKKEVV
jgi:hypothetical protein